jgi:phage repressor protein C with HTH and peptisase S24 domain
MPIATPADVSSTHAAQLFVLTLEVPGVVSANAGVMLVDPARNAAHVRLRRDWEEIAPEEAEILEALQDDLESKAAEMGAARLVGWLGETLSNAVRISEPRDVIVEDFERALGRHYRQHVQTHARPYVTHLPRYSLAVAAGNFLDNPEIDENLGEDDWEEAPAGLRLSEGMFVARIAGRSMEPRIPDGSLCVFRRFGAGSRNGKLVLVEYLGGGTNDRYTVKRYVSEKTRGEDDAWSHERIRLEALNPEFESWDLDPEEDRYRVLAEFVQVLY